MMEEESIAGRRQKKNIIIYPELFTEQYLN